MYKKCNVEKIESVQRRATRMILCQRRGEQSYQDRIKTLNLMTLESRRIYLSISFACSCLTHASPFLYCRWCVNPRYNDLTFKQTVTPKTNHFKFCLWVQFPVIWSTIPTSVRNMLITNNFNTFKRGLKAHFIESSM